MYAVTDIAFPKRKMLDKEKFLKYLWITLQIVLKNRELISFDSHLHVALLTIYMNLCTVQSAEYRLRFWNSSSDYKRVVCINESHDKNNRCVLMCIMCDNLWQLSAFQFSFFLTFDLEVLFYCLKSVFYKNVLVKTVHTEIRNFGPIDFNGDLLKFSAITEAKWPCHMSYEREF